MGLFSKAFKLGAVASLIVSIIIGSFMAGIPKQLGLFRALARAAPGTTHLLPVFVDDEYEWGYNFAQLSAADLSNQTALVTGANSGTGYSTALALARAGAHVTITCRSEAKCNGAASRIRSNTTHGHVDTLLMDTSKLGSVKRAAEEFKGRGYSSLDMLFLNAGIAGTAAEPDGRMPLSEDGIELMFATNFVGHHLLYKIVAHLLRKSPRARIVLTSSASHFDSYEYGVATDLPTLNGAMPGVKNEPYGQSKLAQVLWAQELTRLLGPDSNVFVNSYHPGMCFTGVWDSMEKVNELQQCYNPYSAARASHTTISCPTPLHTIPPCYPLCLKQLTDRVQLHPTVIAFMKKYVSSMMWTSDEGALTGVYLGIEVGKPGHEHRGAYFHPVALATQKAALANNLDLQKDVWEFSNRLVEEYH